MHAYMHVAHMYKLGTADADEDANLFLTGPNKSALSMRCLSTAALTRKTLYDVLGVPSNSSRQEIKAQFYRLSLLYHPDLSPTDECQTNSAWRHEKFLQISHAYSVLANDQRRREYDREVGIVSVGRRTPGWPTAPRQTSHMGATRMTAREEVVLDTLGRWTRWTDESPAAKASYERGRQNSSASQREEKETIKNRLWAVIASIVLYIFLANPANKGS